jgi:hypothetical protein
MGQAVWARRFRLGAVPIATASLVGAAVTIPALTAAASTPSRCHTAQLAVRIGREGVALGHVGVEIHLVNVSPRSCTLRGYPGLQMLDSYGHALPTDVLRGASYTVPKMSEHLVTLPARARATFDAGWNDSTGYGLKKCPTSSRVLITPPNAYRSISVAWRIQPYGGGTIQNLHCGEITVSPIFAARPQVAG